LSNQFAVSANRGLQIQKHRQLFVSVNNETLFVAFQGAGRTTHVNGVVPVPDAGSTLPLLGSALLAVAALRRKLSR
jgi:hypothetical protein